MRKLSENCAAQGKGGLQNEGRNVTRENLCVSKICQMLMVDQLLGMNLPALDVQSPFDVLIGKAIRCTASPIFTQSKLRLAKLRPYTWEENGRSSSRTRSGV